MKEFETTNLIIRKFREEDAKDILENCTYNGKKKKKYNLNACEDYEMIKAELKSAIKLSNSDYPLWAIEEKSSNKLIGFVSANKSLNGVESFCEITFYIEELNKSRKNREYLKITLEIIVEYLMNEEKIDNIVTEVYNCKTEESKQVINILEEIGMKKDKILRERILGSDLAKLENVIIFSIKRKDLKILHSI